jgi:hypothetical protein
LQRAFPAGTISAASFPECGNPCQQKMPVQVFTMGSSLRGNGATVSCPTKILPKAR